MAEELKGLIDKIRQEGVQAGQERAAKIKAEATVQAEAITNKAREEADKLLAQTRQKVAKLEASGEASLRQAGRDFLIVLRKEIESMLEGLVLSKVSEALTPEELSKIILELIKNYSGEQRGNIVISLKKEDKAKLEKGFLSQLKEKTKKEIVLRSREDISAGFVISFDSHKSHFNFTDKALTEYLTEYLKPKLGEMLKDIAAEDKKD